MASAASAAVTNKILRSKDVDLTKIVFGQMNKDKRGGKSIALSYNGGPLRLQVPEAKIQFDVEEHKDDVGGGQTRTTYTAEISMQGFDEPGHKMHDFFKCVSGLDDLILGVAEQRSAEIFGDVKSRDVIKEFHRSLVRHKNPKFSPLLKIKIAPVATSGELPMIFDGLNGNAPLDISALVKHTRVRLIISITSIWFVNKTFGVTARLFQACVTEKPNANPNQFLFQDDDDDMADVANPALPRMNAFQDEDLDV
jgi:hypothetical protein